MGVVVTTGPANAAIAAVPPGGEPMPFYFCGTDSVATGAVVATQNPLCQEEIVEAWLYVGGELVNHKAAPPGSELSGGMICPPGSIARILQMERILKSRLSASRAAATW